ncbi:TCDD-inducible poly [ADP-ribose] polymerase [Channa argus]|uniref:Poly [ADP-ribose] polymerase n=1 Tax=Channa argus TaxID=215402 RepID=A0A6G1QSN7_CHAAH|nr:TCDD-inducible poly [ADP-ribose] polymerase [Channa argus]
MAEASCPRGAKRKMAAGEAETLSKSSRVPLLLPPLLLEIPADTNTSLPVWEAIRSQQVDVSWTFNPYSISVRLTPAASKRGKTATSSKRQATANVAKASALSSIIPQPQVVTQPITQQHGASHGASCVLLAFTQTSTHLLPCPSGQPQTVTPQSPTFFIPSLPLIITQSQPAHQPSTPTKSGVSTAIQSPTTTPTKLRAPPKTLVPFLFHTKISPNIHICDSFLLNMCHEGKKCKMHHTPYPFHWQLWCVTTHEWVDIPARSQVLLERNYCNVSNESVSIKDGRLSNSESPVKNPYFPSKWKLYWWNNFTWEEYDRNRTTLLLKKMRDKKPECSFHIGAQEYKLDFYTMTQTNVTTGFQRKVRCRPVYHSPDSIQPYLRTGIHTDCPEAPSDPPGVNFSVNPLEEFSAWYPPVWCLTSEENYSLVGVPAGTQAYHSVQNLFFESLPETRVDIISIQQVQNLLHWDKYQRHKVYMQKLLIKLKEPLERHLFHGTTKEASKGICHNNFDPRLAGVNGASYGFGSYFATTASLSNTYSATVGPDEEHHMFLAKVLVGKVSLGRNNYRRPPPLYSKTKQYLLYDTCVDDMSKPTTFVVFDSCQCYPYYLIKYKGLPREIDI